MTPFESMLENLRPRCLDGVCATRTDAPYDRDCSVTAFNLAPKNGSDGTCRVLGYLLGDYNPECQSDHEFVGPLSVQWNDDSEACVFDSDMHGYHGEMNCSAKIRGEGIAKPYRCQQCGRDEFQITVQFDYWDACEDMIDDEPDIPIQDYFNNMKNKGSRSRYH